jgi:hypothetical protein
MRDRVSPAQPKSGTSHPVQLARPPAPLSGESAADYEALHARVAALVRPSDVIEVILVGATDAAIGRAGAFARQVRSLRAPNPFPLQGSDPRL